MTDDQLVQTILEKKAKTSSRFSMWLPILFSVTVFFSIFFSVLSADTEAMADRRFYVSMSVGFLIILLLYVTTWVHCYRGLRELKDLQIVDEKLKRLKILYRYSCYLFMIPPIFFLGMLGFFKLKKFLKVDIEQGTLDTIIYRLLIER